MSELKDRIAAAMKTAEIEHYGCCAFSQLELTGGVRSRRIPDGIKGVIAAVFPYGYEKDSPLRNVSRYAVADDYHSIVSKRLERAAGELERSFPGESFLYFCDISPIDEIQAAALCSLGRIGRNNLLINETFGSQVFIGEILTTLPLPEAEGPVRYCRGCGICIRKCPTGALSESGFNKQLCLSFITQQKGELTEEQRTAVKSGGLAWGCDICQQCCPENAGAELRPLPEFEKNRDMTLTMNNLDEMIERKSYGYKGRKILERNLQIIEGE